MTQSYRFIALAVFAAGGLLLPGRGAAQSGTVTDDAFASSNSTTQSVNLNGQGLVLIVAGSSATVGTARVGATKTFLRFQLQSSLPPSTAAANVAKATLKLFVSTGISPVGTIDLYPVTGDWSEATLNPSSPPALSSTPFATGIPVGKSNSFLVVDVTQLVQAWLNGAANGGLENHGITLVASTSTSYVVFDSKEGIVTSHEPRLEIVLASSGPQGPAGPQGPQGPAGPQGASGANGSAGTPGSAATVQVGNTITAPAGSLASVLNTGTPNSAVLNFLIPQGAAGAPGPQGPAGLTNRGPWNAANAYSINDAVSDQGSFWLALQAIPANTPNSEPSSTNTSWQLLAAQGTPGAQGLQGIQGPKGDQGSMGLPGAPGQNPAGAALTTTSNAFAGNQTINGNLILGGGGGVQFTDGSVQTTASLGGGGGIPAGYMITGTTPVAPPGYTLSGSLSAGNLWASMPPMPTARWSFAAAAVNGKIYVIGGYNGSSQLNMVEVYDPAGNNGIGSWSTGPAMPTARSGLAAAAVNGKVYAIGGEGTGGILLNTVEVFDPAGNNGLGSWSTAASMPNARRSLAAAAVNGKIYAIGGFGTSPRLNTVEVYDPNFNSWSTAAPMPSVRSDLAAAAVNGKIYAIGGYNNTSGNLNTVEVYDPATNAWSTAPPMPTPRYDLAAAAVNGKIYVIGGYSSGVMSLVEVYDPSFNSWRTAASMPTARQSLAAADTNGLIYAVGGFNNAKLDVTEHYSPPVTIYTFIKN